VACDQVKVKMALMLKNNIVKNVLIPAVYILKNESIKALLQQSAKE
jgi:hypothetical protein